MKLKSNHKRQLGFLILVGALALNFQNCGQPGAIEVASNTDVGGLDVVNGSPDSDAPPTNPPSGGSPSPMPAPAATYKSYTKNFNVNQGSGKVDVLIVVDNSGSMEYEQKSMADRFDSFIDSLAGLDWQVGITTTDYRSTVKVNNQTVDLAGGDGKLLAYSQNKFLIKSSDNLATAKQLFASTIQRSESGTGLEQGINATYRSIERAISADSSTAYNQNKNLIRDGASLAIIVITDDDETAAKNSDGAQLHGDRSTFGYRNFPENLNSFIKTKYPAKKVKFNSIIVRPNDSACYNNSTSFINAKGENEVNDNEFYGNQYKIISDFTGGIIGNVCATDYGEQLKIIGEASADLVREVLLECAPVDQNGDGQVELAVQDEATKTALTNYTLARNKITFAAYLPVSSYKISYTCYN